MKNLLLMLGLFGFLAFTTSCGDDDDCDVDAIEDKIEDLFDDYAAECISGGDCDDCLGSIEDIIDYLKDNKGCASEIEDVDEDDIDDEIEGFEEVLEFYQDQCE